MNTKVKIEFGFRLIATDFDHGNFYEVFALPDRGYSVFTTISSIAEPYQFRASRQYEMIKERLELDIMCQLS